MKDTILLLTCIHNTQGYFRFFFGGGGGGGANWVSLHLSSVPVHTYLH